MTTGLQFMEGGDKISPTECVKKYEDTGHETIIRELTQNALDAARDAGRECTMRFEVRELKTDSLPGIREYREHLRREYMQEWLGKGQKKYLEVLDRLTDLATQEKTECLLVFDNGVGLDYRSMEGLIGKGDSGKRENDGASGGTHGVGHETAFAAGDMNYVMYGGVNRESGKLRPVASGHVVFPTHLCVESKVRWGGHGYLSHDVAQVTLSGVAIVDSEKQIPPLIQNLLDEIDGAGSVVIIPAFNRFPGDGDDDGTDTIKLICEDIAKHFFVAVDQDRLNVFVYDYSANENGNPLKDQLDDKHDVVRALNRVKNNKRARGNRLIAGFRSHESWLTYRTGDEYVLKTSFGKVKARIRYHEDQRSRIAIVRAGMFITDEENKLPRELARRHFSMCKPFDAVLLFADDVDHPTEADNIVRAAEDAGHSGIRSHMREGVGKQASELFREIQQELLKVLESKPKGKSHTPDFLPIKVHAQRGSTPPRVIPRPRPEPTPRPDTDGPDNPFVPEPNPHPNPHPNPRPKPKPKRHVRKQLIVPASVVPSESSPGRLEVDIGPSTRTVSNAILYLETRTGSDATCESPLRGQEIMFDLSRCFRDGGPLRNARGNGREIQLGKLDKGLATRLTLQLASGENEETQLRAVLYEGGSK